MNPEWVRLFDDGVPHTLSVEVEVGGINIVQPLVQEDDAFAVAMPLFPPIVIKTSELIMPDEKNAEAPKFAVWIVPIPTGDPPPPPPPVAGAQTVIPPVVVSTQVLVDEARICSGLIVCAIAELHISHKANLKQTLNIKVISQLRCSIKGND